MGLVQVLAAAGAELEPGVIDSVPPGDEYAVGWFTLALINAGLAQGKYRRGWVWFLLSLPLGPVATLLVVVLEAQGPRQVSAPVPGAEDAYR